MPRFARLILLTALLLGVLLTLLALIPGDFSPLGTLKTLADRLVSDGNFETITLSLYNKLRLALGAGGVLLLALGGGVFYARRRPRLATSLAVGLLIMTGAGLLIAGNLAVSRLNSPVYRLLAGTPLAYTPPTPAPSPSPTATLLAANPARWELIADDLGDPVILASPPGDTSQLFVGSKSGLIRRIHMPDATVNIFLNLQDWVMQEVQSPEQGFLGLAFHPNYIQNGYFYVSYTDSLGDVNLVRFQTSADDPTQADPATFTRLLRILKPQEVHNGGHLAFGPDGYLYFSMGDGGIQGDLGGYAQSLDLLLGKILRLDVDSGFPYAIPPDNPFVGTHARSEIWLYGLRNPWRFSFDSATGDMFIGDVGHEDFEEINYVPAGSPGGLNFGWNHYEGTDLYNISPNRTMPPLPDHVPPIREYRNHRHGTCAVIGGYVYRGPAVPALQGTYLYGDYCSGLIWGLRQNTDGTWENTLLFNTDFFITSFGTDADQNLYLTDLRGQVYKLVGK